MSKIVQVVNAMISNKEKITNVIPNNREYFFLYDKKYRWSISPLEDENYNLFLYPSSNESTNELALKEDHEWAFYNLIRYTTKEIKTKEAYESFHELYQTVSEKSYGIDGIFDDILRG